MARRYQPAETDPCVILYAEAMVLRTVLEHMVHDADPDSRYQRLKARRDLVEEQAEKLVPTSVLGESMRLLELVVALDGDHEGNHASWAASKLSRMMVQLPHREAKGFAFG